MKNIFFGWLRIFVDDYEKKVGDGKARDFWNWMIETYKPEDWDKIMEDIDGEHQ